VVAANNGGMVKGVTELDEDEDDPAMKDRKATSCGLSSLLHLSGAKFSPVVQF